jgi:hypothetical protein
MGGLSAKYREPLVLGEQLSQGVLVRATNRRETADLEVPELACSTLLPTGSSPTR